MDRSLQILLVDPEAESRDLAERGLRAEGIDVTYSPSDTHALSRCFVGAFDAVFLNLDMILGGNNLARRLREHVAFKSLPIIGFAKRPGLHVPPGSGLDLVVDGIEPRRWISALHALRQERGFLAAPHRSPMARYQF